MPKKMGRRRGLGAKVTLVGRGKKRRCIRKKRTAAGMRCAKYATGGAAAKKGKARKPRCLKWAKKTGKGGKRRCLRRAKA